MAHQGGVAKIALYSDHSDRVIISTGLKDGVLNIFDMRSHQPIFKERVHGGAINFVSITQNGEIVTGSADKTVKLF